MTKQAFVVMCVLVDAEAVSFFSGITIAEVMRSDKCKGISYSVIYRSLDDLYKQGLVKVGATERNAYTYYLTEAGIELYNNEL